MDEHDLSELIGRIYDAAVDSQSWPAFLEDLVHQVQPEGKAVLLIDDIAARNRYHSGQRADRTVLYEPLYHCHGKVESLAQSGAWAGGGNPVHQ